MMQDIIILLAVECFSVIGAICFFRTSKKGSAVLKLIKGVMGLVCCGVFILTAYWSIVLFALLK